MAHGAEAWSMLGALLVTGAIYARGWRILARRAPLRFGAGRLAAFLGGLGVIAVALAPPLLLADEPTGNLDSATGAQIVDLLLGLNRERRSTLLLVTHDPALAGRAGRAIALRDGRVVNGHAGG